MDDRLESIFDVCLDEMRHGRDMEEILGRHPEHASELRSLLTLAIELSSLPKPEPTETGVNCALLRMGEAVSQQAQPGAIRSLWRRIRLLNPIIAQALAFVTLAIVAVASLDVLASGSLPGDLLYPMKLTTERVQFILTRSPEGRGELRLQFAEERTDELVEMVEEGLPFEESLVRELLWECQMALDEVSPVGEAPFTLFRVKLCHMAEFQEEALSLIKSIVPESRRKCLDRAIELCHKRCAFLREMTISPADPDGKVSETGCREWPPDCRCMDADEHDVQQ